MIFADLQAGDAVFLDANTFVYHAAPDPILGPPCSHLLQRIENQELVGYTSLHLLPEVAHKMMTTEANARLGWPFAGMANRLRRHPPEVQKLTAHRLTLDRIVHSRLQILPFTVALMLAASMVSQQYGLLTNDAIVVAVIQAHGLTKLASHDGDFDRVPGITRYAPV
jgi:predicted nucleic acid-binding protein